MTKRAALSRRDLDVDFATAVRQRAWVLRMSYARLVERSGVVFELDAVVVAPHAVFVVEIKS